jgi:hypothetical protein
MGIAEFIIGPAEGRTRWLPPFYVLRRRSRLSARVTRTGMSWCMIQIYSSTTLFRERQHDRD